MIGGWAATSGLLRVARAGTVSAVAVGIGAAAHVGSGGCLPAGAAVAAFVIVALASWVLAAAELTVPLLLTWLGAAQVFTHLVLHAACPDTRVGVGAGGLMLGWHVLALLASAAALRSGETALWVADRLSRAMRRIAEVLVGRALAGPVPAVDLPWVVTGRPELPTAGRELVSGAIGRRGPPAGRAVR